jgi:hypothetical protein
MHRPWLAPIIILFWCLTTTWLVAAKIVPSLLPGSPPGYQALYASNNRLIPVAWAVVWKDQPLGWAVSDSHREDDGGVTVETVLHFERLPIDELLPPWTKPLIGRSLDRSLPLDFEARGTLFIDPRGQLQAFRSTVDLPGGADKVLLNGTVDDGHVKITLQAGELSYETSRYLPSHVMIGDELSPQATMPGLVMGKRWTVPVYSPLRGGTAALEVLHAEVVGEETLFWEDRLLRVDLVVYRDDPSSHHEPCCRIWVDRSGRVLKQESMIFGSTLTFVRRSDEAAEGLARSLQAISLTPTVSADAPQTP